MKYLLSLPRLFLLVGCAWGVLSLCGLLRASTLRQRLQTLTYRATCRIWKLRITIDGELAPPPALIVANHCSYMDVAILGSLGAMRFTPKKEVKSWFLIGRIVQAFDVIFVDRTPSKTNDTQATLQRAMTEGGRLCVFPEGTTNNGRSLKPFKSAMFSLITHTETPLTLQPIAIQYQRVDGHPLTDADWDRIAWFGDSALIPHMWQLARFSHIEVTVHCLPPISTEGKDRKALCALAEAAIAGKIAARVTDAATASL
jgi:1-acyl-sn-glycerol-3-phosphate acyltransferase